MKRLKAKLIIALIAISSSILLTACGGGGGGGDNTQSSGDTPDQPSSGNINGGLTGRIFVADGWVVDVSTGRSKRIPGVWWDDDCEGCVIDVKSGYGADARYNAQPNMDGTEFILTVFDCDPNYQRDCLVIHDFGGSKLGYAWINEGLDFGAKLSRDNNYIAFAYNPDSTDSVYDRQSELHIVDRQFQHISVGKMSNGFGFSFDWLNTGQIVYSHYGTIYITAPYSTEGTPIYSFLDAVGDPTVGIGGLDASPDGTKIAFRLVTERNASMAFANVWVMNIDGTDLHRLVHTPDTDYQLYDSFAWSPDGKYILVEEGGVVGGLVGTPSGGADKLYAIPSESRDVAINNEGNNGIIRLRTDYRSPSGFLRYEFNASSSYRWLPDL